MFKCGLQSRGTYIKLLTPFRATDNQGRLTIEQIRYPFQAADDAMQMDVHQTPYPFYHKEYAQCYSNSHKNCASLAEMPLFHS